MVGADTATSLNNLALHYYEGKPEETGRLMHRTLTICETALGPKHPDTQSSRESLAAIEERLQNTWEGIVWRSGASVVGAVDLDS